MSIYPLVAIGEVLDKIIGGGTPSKKVSQYWNGSIPWCSVKDMKEGCYSLSKTQDTITEEGLKNSASNLIPAGTVITSTRMGLGRAFINQVNMSINQDLKALIPNSKVDNFFLLWSIIYQKDIIEGLGTGATVKGIRLEALKSIKIPLPPLPIQQKIAGILSAYDDLIENNLKRIKLLEELAQITYEEWFVRLCFPNHENTPINPETGLPEGWEKKKLKEFLTLNYGKALKADTRVEGNIPVYGSSGVVGMHNNPLVKGSGVIVGRKGNVGSVFWSHNSFHPIDTVYFASSEHPLEFIYYTLKNSKFDNSDAAVPGLNRDAAYAVEAILPSQEIKILFTEHVKSNFKIIQNLENQNQRLREARDILLPRLMTGMIDVEQYDPAGLIQEAA